MSPSTEDADLRGVGHTDLRGRAVGAHLSTVDLYASPTSPGFRGERKQQHGFSDAKYNDDDDDYDDDEGEDEADPYVVEVETKHESTASKYDDNGEDDNNTRMDSDSAVEHSSTANVAEVGAQGGEEEAEDVEALRARMRARLKKKKSMWSYPFVLFLHW